MVVKRKRRLGWLAVLAVGAVSVPALAAGDAAPMMASFTAVDIPTNPSPTNHQWYVNGMASTSPSTTIAAGGTVLFTYPAGGPPHNVVFADLQPTSCMLAGAASDSTPPMPALAVREPWSGICRFETPGAYAFRCAVHRLMTGTVEVVAATAAPTTPPLPLPAVAPAPSVSAPPPPPPAASALVASSQRGPIVRGSLAAVGPDAWFYVHVVADRATLGSRGTGNATVGRLVKFNPTGGNVPFNVHIAPAAARALRQKGRLALTARVLVLPKAGARFTASYPVTLRWR